MLGWGAARRISGAPPVHLQCTSSAARLNASDDEHEARPAPPVRVSSENADPPAFGMCVQCTTKISSAVFAA